MKPEQSRLAENNLGLVHACARRYIGRGEEYEDIFQAGCVGLVKAALSFMPEKGFAFSTYAVPVILGEIRCIFRDSGSIKVSRKTKELSMRINRCQSMLADRLGRPAQISEIAQHLGESREAVAEAICSSQRPVSLSPVNDGDCPHDIPTDEHDTLLERLALKMSIANLEPEDRLLLSLRYTREFSQVQTAKLLGISQVSVSRRERRILKSLNLYQNAEI